MIKGQKHLVHGHILCDIILFRTFKPYIFMYLFNVIMHVNQQRPEKQHGVSFMHFNTMIDKVKTI